MTEATETKKKHAPATGSDQKPSNKIEAYLSVPKKKKKNYIVIALGENFDRDLSNTMEAYIRKNHAQHSISSPRTEEEFTRQFSRNISLLIINDEFIDRMTMMNLIRILKQRHRNELIPIIFLTKNPDILVSTYHQELLMYHEGDEYVDYSSLDKSTIIARIKYGIENKNQRRSRRYAIKIPMSTYHLNKDETLRGEIIDLSMHGALIIVENDVLFKLGDQLKLIIPIAKYILDQSGDFLRISAKVRRVFISGNKVAISFEHVTETQARLVAELLIQLVDIQFKKQVKRLKTQEKTSPSNNSMR